jgi:hypothetical protein
MPVSGGGAIMIESWLSKCFVFGVKNWLRWGKPLLSKTTNTFKPQLSIASTHTFESLEDFAEWLKAHTKWKGEPLRGLFDTYPSLEHLNWQLDTKGYVEDDCDGLAYFAAVNVIPFCDSPSDSYVVSVIFDPLEVALESFAHAICVFKSGGMWRVISNGELDPGKWQTLDEAVLENGACRRDKEALRCVEKRTSDLRLVASAMVSQPGS